MTRSLTDAEYDRCIKEHLCFCGSMKPKSAEYDARGIFLTYVCDACRADQLSHYRPDVLTNSRYEADEQIDEDY